MSKRKGTRILNGRATLHSPTGAKRNWRVLFIDPIVGNRRELSGTSRDEAIAKCREALGDWDRDQEPQKVKPPTLNEAFEAWIASSRSKWVDRTVAAYEALYRGSLARLGEKPVTMVTPKDLQQIAESTTRGQAKRVRTITRGIFDTVERWTGNKGAVYADAVRIPGSKSDDAPPVVEKAQVPSTEWITGVINCAYASCQLHPVLNHPSEHLDEISGEHTDTRADTAELSADWWFKTEALRLGAPLELIESMRRGMPKHYKQREQRRRDETIELASRFRRVALMTALGAAGALRIGEVLALRPRHLFGLGLDQNTARKADQAMHTVLTRELAEGYEPTGTEEPNGLLLPGYRGKIEVVEQVSPLNSGRMAISAPKMNRNRTVWLAPLMYPAWDDTNRSLRALLTDPQTPGVERFDFDAFNPADLRTSLWSMTEVDAYQLWRAGFVPVAYLLHDRLREMWRQANGDLKLWWNALLFPSRNSGRQRGQGPHFPNRWPHQKEPSFGTFQSPTNLTTRYVAPLYDHVSEVVHSWPGYRAGTRDGYSHHALRHWAISSWLSRGVPISTVSKQAGHRHEAFTLSRYSWALQEHFPERGFEP